MNDAYLLRDTMKLCTQIQFGFICLMSKIFWVSAANDDMSTSMQESSKTIDLQETILFTYSIMIINYNQYLVVSRPRPLSPPVTRNIFPRTSNSPSSMSRHVGFVTLSFTVLGFEGHCHFYASGNEFNSLAAYYTPLLFALFWLLCVDVVCLLCPYFDFVVVSIFIL